MNDVYKPRAVDFLQAEQAPDAPSVGPARLMRPFDPGKHAAVREALLWAWANVTGRLPDENTMTADEIAAYLNEYAEKVLAAFTAHEGCHPDEYTRKKALS